MHPQPLTYLCFMHDFMATCTTILSISLTCASMCFISFGPPPSFPHQPTCLCTLFSHQVCINSPPVKPMGSMLPPNPGPSHPSCLGLHPLLLRATSGQSQGPWTLSLSPTLPLALTLASPLSSLSLMPMKHGPIIYCTFRSAPFCTLEVRVSFHRPPLHCGLLLSHLPEGC